MLWVKKHWQTKRLSPSAILSVLWPGYKALNTSLFSVTYLSEVFHKICVPHYILCWLVNYSMLDCWLGKRLLIWDCGKKSDYDFAGRNFLRLLCWEMDILKRLSECGHMYVCQQHEKCWKKGFLGKLSIALVQKNLFQDTCSWVLSKNWANY